MNAHLARRVFLAVLALGSLVLAVVWWSALLPFTIGIVIAYLLDPLVLFAQRKLRIKRLPALLIVFVLFLSLFLFVFISLFPLLARGVSSLMQTIASNQEEIAGFVKDSMDWFDGLPLPIDHADLVSKLQNLFAQFFGAIYSFVLSFIGSIPLLIIVPLIVFYLLKDKDAIFAALKRYIRDENETRARGFFDEIDVRLGGYVKGQFLLSALVTVITYIALLIFDVPYALLIGIANGILNIIPYFGPVIGAVPAVVLELLYFSSSGHLVALIVFFVVMNILVTTLISPKIFATATNLHPLLVLLALFIGSYVMGMVGMIVAVPFAIVVQTVLRALFDKYIKEI